MKYAAPITACQAARLDAVGLLADTPPDLCEAWRRVEQMWVTTAERFSALPQAALNTRVGGEWSYLETLRHLVFVTDVWLGDVVQDGIAGYDPLGVPPDFVTNGVDLGLDPTVTPTVGQVLASRRRAIAAVRDHLAGVTSEELDGHCAKFEGQFTVLGALQNIVFEEWAHHVYAVRDLDQLETAGPDFLTP